MQYLKNWPVWSNFDLETHTRIAWREVGDNEILVASFIEYVGAITLLLIPVAIILDITWY